MSRGFRLYEIAEQYRAFVEVLDSVEIPDDVVADTLDALEGAFEEKAEAVACIVKELRAEAEAIKAEEAILASRRKTKENRADWLENYLYGQLKTIGRDRFETARAKVKFTHGERVQIDNEAEFVSWAQMWADDLLTFRDPVVDKTAVKAALKAGRELPGASLEKTEKARVR